MSKYRKNASIRVGVNSDYDNTLNHYMAKRERVMGRFLPPHPALDTEELYIVQSRTELNKKDAIYTLEMCNAAPDTMPTGVSNRMVTGITRAAFLAAGWTDELLQQGGWVSVEVMVRGEGHEVGSVASPPAAPAPEQPTLADLMREIQVLQHMVASQAQYAHGAPLVRV